MSRTLGELVNALVALEDETLTQDGSAFVDLTVDEIKSKVDNIKAFMDFVEFEEERLKKEAAGIQARRKSMANVKKSLERHIVNQLSGRFEKLPGHRYQLFLKVNPGELETKLACTKEMALAYPEYVRCKYEWDKKALKAAIADGDIGEEMAEIVKETVVRFSLNAGLTRIKGDGYE